MTRKEMVKTIIKDMKEYWKILCEEHGIYPIFNVMSTASTVSVRAADLINSGVMTKAEALETALLTAQQNAANCFVATTTHIIKGGDKFEYNSRVVFNIEILNIILFIEGGDISDILEYLKLMMQHEFGHCIVYSNLAKQCGTINQFVEQLDKRNVVYDSEYKKFEEYAKEKATKDILVYYNTNISEERDANMAMKVNIARMVEIDIKLKTLMDASIQEEIPSIKDVVIK